MEDIIKIDQKRQGKRQLKQYKSVVISVDGRLQETNSNTWN